MLRDSSMSNVVFAGDTTSLQMLLQGGKSDANPWVPKSVLCGSGPAFPNRNFAAISESLCRVLSEIVMEENHTIASLRRPGNILLEVFCELHGVARYLCVHQQYTRRPREVGGQDFTRNWCHLITIHGLAGGVSTPCWITYWWEWNDGSTCYRHQQMLDEGSCLPLLFNVTENWGRPSFLMICGLLTHDTPTGAGLILVTHPPRYAAQCSRINQGQMQ